MEVSRQLILRRKEFIIYKRIRILYKQLHIKQNIQELIVLIQE